MPKGLGYKQRGPTGKAQHSVRKIKKAIKKDKKKQKRVTNMGRILEGPRGGQFTPRKARKDEF